MIFYTPDIVGERYTLSEEESGHAVRVLRLREGDEITLVDGKGNLFRATIVDPHHKRCEARVTEVMQGYGKRLYHLNMAVAPTKNIDRFEWFVEKSVEIGVDEITPLVCERSERRHLRSDRILSIMIAAMKQSKKAYLPRLNEPILFDEWVETVNGNGFIAHCGTGVKQPLKAAYRPGSDAVIAIGPEGDFSRHEIDRALSGGFVGIDLGKSRLRTETAGVAACCAVFFMNDSNFIA